MKLKWANAGAVCVSLLLAAASGAVAQSRPPGGSPPPPPSGTPSGQRGPGGVSQPRGMNGSGFPRMPAGRRGDRREVPGPSSPGAARDTTNPIHFGPVGRWWDDRQVMRSIGLTKQQQRKMDSIFNANKPAIVDSYNAYLREKAKLDAISNNSSADKSTMFATIDSVNQARANLQKATAQMLLEIREQMEPDQIEKLEKLE